MLTLTGETVALNADGVDVDASTFEHPAKAGDAGSLARAVALYRGDFMEGLAFRGTLFEDWLMAERARLRELAIESLARLLRQQRGAAGAAGDALQTALRLIALDPLQEPVHRSHERAGVARHLRQFLRRGGGDARCRPRGPLARPRGALRARARP